MVGLRKLSKINLETTEHQYGKVLTNVTIKHMTDIANVISKQNAGLKVESPLFVGPIHLTSRTPLAVCHPFYSTSLHRIQQRLHGIKLTKRAFLHAFALRITVVIHTPFHAIRLHAQSQAAQEE